MVDGMKCLDLGCGLGGWSKGFDVEGFDCVGVDIVDVGYPYRLILQDINTLDGHDYTGFDVIVGSMPCRDFTQATSLSFGRWKDPPNPERGLVLVKAFLRVVEEAEPRLWLMENVPRLARYLDIKAIMTVNLGNTMRRSFWGNFPMFLITPDYLAPNKEDIKGKNRSWLRAEIPITASRPIARAFKDYLLTQYGEEVTSVKDNQVGGQGLRQTHRLDGAEGDLFPGRGADTDAVRQDGDAPGYPGGRERLPQRADGEAGEAGD